MAAVHTPHTPPAPPRAGEPHLASSLLGPSPLESILDALTLDDAHMPPETLRTYVPSLDAALCATFQGGSVVALSAESSVRDLVARTLLVDALLRYPASAIAVIDTAGNFDVVGLYRMVVARLQMEPENAGMRGGASGVQEVAAKTLDRVKILRVFDFVGMREAVGELRGELEGRGARGECGALGEQEMALENAPAAEVVGEEVPSRRLERTEVADSEDEEEGLEDSDDEMLFDAPAPPTAPSVPQPASNHASSPPTPSTQQSTPSSAPAPATAPVLKMILIDNLAHVLTPLLKQDTTSANTLATTFLVTLSNLTQTHALHTILLNPCTTPRAPSPSRKAADTAALGPQQAYRLQPPPPPSVFSSNKAVPALLGLMSRYADAHVLVGMLPRRKMDARVYYADTGGRERGKRRGVEMVGVVEVVADRWGGRVGAWGAFKEGKDGGIEGL
ncbi:uncharacterized protein M421DRAFT_424700 [Didymella exigua CBS 183.55]|uniref:DNA recombination and repair protein Rad51-like C-terminal domain-containing protein n=1 Tax=Didymella exigua CBS 183.55 TaxID=1150837 RepID=A0A6A5R8N0_9PLEO|nr:uncharacterized protein M421DRAFT_424700 [Didymella exigua CBS 183.55]KAF1924565.1 hypothetical protein M421DRAFT_424700 [Didymella exigua CBS 183.55]